MLILTFRSGKLPYLRKAILKVNCIHKYSFGRNQEKLENELGHAILTLMPEETALLPFYYLKRLF